MATRRRNAEAPCASPSAMDLMFRIMELLGWSRRHRGPRSPPSGNAPGPVSGIASAQAITQEPGEEAQPQKVQVVVFFLGPHRVLVNGQPIDQWPNGRSRSLFNLLVTRRQRRVPKELLMETFWPNASMDVARGNLNATVYALRKTLERTSDGVRFVMYENGCYFLNPELDVWVDAEEFARLVSRAAQLEGGGDPRQAVRDRLAAIELYEDEYLADERYSSWVVETRARYESEFLASCETLSRHFLETKQFQLCLAICARMLAIDRCDEAVHRRMMVCYSRREQLHLALRQYHVCCDALAAELRATPGQETVRLHDAIRHHRAV